jgi:hypothetical protein
MNNRKKLSKTLNPQENNFDAEYSEGMILHEDKQKALMILKRLKKDEDNSFPFRKPVNWRQLGLNDYPEIIKTPMDISTVEKKLVGGDYKIIQEFFDDLNLIWRNCKTYNLEGSGIYNQAENMEKLAAKLIKSSFPSPGESQKTPSSESENLAKNHSAIGAEATHKKIFSSQFDPTESAMASNSNQIFNINNPDLDDE